MSAFTWTVPGYAVGKEVTAVCEFEDTPFKIDLQEVRFTPEAGRPKEDNDLGKEEEG